MGNRANFVIVKDQDWQLYYSHWGGCRMLDALIGGPDLALRYAASLRRCAKDEWCDPTWADGGAVVDLGRRRVLFFGEPLMVEMNERRALISATRHDPRRRCPHRPASKDVGGLADRRHNGLLPSSA